MVITMRHATYFGGRPVGQLRDSPWNLLQGMGDGDRVHCAFLDPTIVLVVVQVNVLTSNRPPLGGLQDPQVFVWSVSSWHGDRGRSRVGETRLGDLTFANMLVWSCLAACSARNGVSVICINMLQRRLKGACIVGLG